MNMVVGFDQAEPSPVTFRGDRVNHKSVLVSLLVAVMVAVGALAFWYQERSAVQEARARVVAGELQPLASLSKKIRRS